MSTTLIEAVIARLKQSGQRVSVIKHAHHDFDIDHEAVLVENLLGELFETQPAR